VSNEPRPAAGSGVPVGRPIPAASVGRVGPLKHLAQRDPQAVREAGWCASRMCASSPSRIDEYFQKLPGRCELENRIKRLLLRRTYYESVQRYLTCMAKLEAIEGVVDPSVLASDERCLALRATAEELRRSNDAVLGRLSRHLTET